MHWSLDKLIDFQKISNHSDIHPIGLGNEKF